MTTIYKYELKVTDTQTIVLPMGANILHIGVQNYKPFMWALIPDGWERHPPKERKFHTYGTGHQITEERIKYIGSYQISHHAHFVGHVFEDVAP